MTRGRCFKKMGLPCTVVTTALIIGALGTATMAADSGVLRGTNVVRSSFVMRDLSPRYCGGAFPVAAGRSRCSMRGYGGMRPGAS